AAVLLGFGAAKLFYGRLRVSSRMLWIVLFIISGACLLQLQTQHLQGWRRAFNIQGPGGAIGYFFGKKFLLGAMGDVGSMILLGGIYLSALILMTGLRPIHLVRQTVSGMHWAGQRLREWRLHREMRKADIKGQLEISQRELAKQQRSLEKQLKRKGASASESQGMDLDELINRPKPKVVDTTALPSDAIGSRRKPSLAELRPAKTPTSASKAPRFDAEHYVIPSIDLLDEHDPDDPGAADPAELDRVNQPSFETLPHFAVARAAADITKGPPITRSD